MNISKFQIRPSRYNGQYRAYIIGENGEILFWSEQHPDIDNAKHVVSLVDPHHEHPIDVLDINGNVKRRIEPK